jgi:hypothetical protein
LKNRVSEALDWYVSDSQYQPQQPVVRAQLRKLQKAIFQFEAALPHEHDTVGWFIYETYTGEVFLTDNLKPDEDTLIRQQSAWQRRFGFSTAREQLRVMKDYVSAATQCLGDSKPPEHRKKILVVSLARTWRDLRGEWPTSGRDPDTRHQIGPFARFVRIACTAIPDPRLSPEPLDTVIRKVCERRE